MGIIAFAYIACLILFSEYLERQEEVTYKNLLEERNSG